MNLILVGKLFLFYERINLLSLQCRYKKVQLIVSFLVFGIFKSILFETFVETHENATRKLFLRMEGQVVKESFLFFVEQKWLLIDLQE